MFFTDRTTAGMQLAQLLEQCLAKYPDLNKTDMVVVGLPRGGVIVALEVARKFKCPLEILVSKKLPFPGQPEFAIGAVSSDGVIVLNPDVPEQQPWQAYIQRQSQDLLTSTRAMEKRYYELSRCGQLSFKDKTVIVVDDGIATGMTALAALATARKRGAKRTILAVPVISAESFRQLRSNCNEIVAVSVPERFGSVGQHYLNFAQTSTEEVIEALRQSTHFIDNSQNEVEQISA